MLPILQHEVVEKKHWGTEEEIMDYYAMGQCLPGIIMINTASFVGRKQKGTLGSICSAAGAAIPSLIIIIIIAMCLTSFADMPAIKNAFAGIRVCVVVLIINAVSKLWKKAIVDWKCFLLFLTICTLSFFTDISPILFVIASSVIGIILSLFLSREKKEKNR